MRRDIVSAASGIVVLTILLGIVYPLAVTGVAQVAFPGNANGQRVYVHGRLVGSKIIGQQFTDVVSRNGKPITVPDPRYFQTRPSASVPADNAAATAFSNAGPNNLATEQAIAANIRAYLQLEKPYDPSLTTAQIPVDAANTSASGIDPDISIANADIQARRVAAVRRVPLTEVMTLVEKYTHGRGLGFSGEPGVNVLELNLAIDRLIGGGH
jgi:K+-transporting ATPase ATPase C chain